MQNTVTGPRSIRCLIVDDDEDDASLVESYLRDIPDLGVTVDWDPHFDSALAKLSSHSYAVCFVDYLIGQRDGIEFIKTALGSGADLPLILLTGSTDPIVDALAAAAGATDFIAKEDLSERTLARAIRFAEANQQKTEELRQAQYALTKANTDLEFRVAERTAELYGAMTQAKSANRAKSEFLANVSHELRTPLNAVIGFSDIICDETFGPVGSVRYRSYAKDIREAGRHLLDLINDILDLTKIESGADLLNEEDIEIADIACAVETLTKERAQSAELKLLLDCVSDLPRLHADRRKVTQMLVNLVANAIKFSEPGATVKLKAWCEEEDGFVFQIIDTGIGMTLESIPKALSKFGQVDSVLSRPHEGTGLGLPLTKSLIEQHSGSLDLQSEIGVGTTATLRFPAARIVQPSSPASARPILKAG